VRTKGQLIRIGVPDSLNFALWIRRQSEIHTPVNEMICERWWNHLLNLRRMDPLERFYSSAYWVNPDTACLPHEGWSRLFGPNLWSDFLKDETTMETVIDLAGLRRPFREDRWRFPLLARANWVFDVVWDPLSVITQDLIWEGYGVLRWPYHQDPMALEHILTMALNARP